MTIAGRKKRHQINRFTADKEATFLPVWGTNALKQNLNYFVTTAHATTEDEIQWYVRKQKKEEELFMKKLIAVMLVVMLLLGCVACKGEPEDVVQPGNGPITGEETTEQPDSQLGEGLPVAEGANETDSIEQRRRPGRTER